MDGLLTHAFMDHQPRGCHPQDGLKHPWIVTAAAPDPETGREKTVEVDAEALGPTVECRK